MSDSADKQTGALVLGIVGAVAFITWMMLWKAFFLKTIWGWFMVPMGLPAMGWAPAIWLRIALSGAPASDPTKDYWKKLLMTLVDEALILGVLWLTR